MVSLAVKTCFSKGKKGGIRTHRVLKNQGGRDRGAGDLQGIVKYNFVAIKFVPLPSLIWAQQHIFIE